MYWLRQSAIHLIPFAVLFLLAWMGGWLLATHAFHVRPRERLTAGLGIAVILYAVLCNMLGYVTGSTWSFILAALIVLGLGLLSLKGTRRPFFNWGDLRAWPQILWVLIIGLIFTLMLRGLAIWDDYHNLPVVSTIAAGNLPPQFYLDPSIPLSYHYGLHVFAASMVSLGGLTPWSAWDLARGFTTALAIVLAWLWFKRVTQGDLSAYFGAALLTFGSGTLWLLSLLPGGVIQWISARVPLANSALDSGPNLAVNLGRPFLFQGGPPLPMPFSFLGSLFAPVVVNWQGTASLYLVCIFLLLLANDRKRFSIISIVISVFTLALMALNAEYVYGMLLAGMIIVVLVYALYHRRLNHVWFSGLWNILATLILSLVVVLFQGGVITVMVRNLFSGNSNPALNGLGTAGFFFVWPPSLVADFFRPLSILNPAQLIVLLAEMGPAILLLPFIVHWTWKMGKGGHLMEAGLGLAGLLSIFLPLFVHYGVERDTSRITSFGLQDFLILGVPALVLFLKRGSWWKGLVVGGFGLSIISGVVVFSILFTATSTPQLTYFVSANDARMSLQDWNKLARGSWVLDHVPYRAVTIFGLMTRSGPASAPVDFATYPEWQALIKNPNPADVFSAGYRYVYMDPSWWNQLNSGQQQQLEEACVKTVQQEGDLTAKDWRLLLDVSECR